MSDSNESGVTVDSELSISGEDVEAAIRDVAREQAQAAIGASNDTTEVGSGTLPREDVTDHGASGRGSKNDADAVQDAMIDAGETDGESEVHFPDGTYFIGDPVKIPSNVTPVGAGMGNSTLDGAMNGDATLILDTCENVQFEGLTFTKNAAPDNSDSWYFAGTGHNIRFYGCEWRDLPRQAALFRGSDYTIMGCRVQNTGRDGFLFAGVNNPTVSFNKFFRTGDDSIAYNVDTTNGTAVGNTVVEPGWHHAGGGIKIHGNNCAAGYNTFVRPNTYATRIQNRDEDAADEAPWPNRNIFGHNVVNGMGERGGSKNYAVEVKATNGEVYLPNNVINTYDGAGENRRGMRFRATGPTTRIHVKGGSIAMSPEHDPKYGFVVENEFEHLEIDGVSLYNTSDAVLKRNASEPEGDCQIRDLYFDPGRERQLFDCVDDDGFDLLRITGCTSKAPGSPFADFNDASFGLVQVHDNYTRGHDTEVAGTDRVDELVTGAL